MAAPPPPNNPFAPSQAIRIPTFASPIARAPPDTRVKTREEERFARLKGPTQSVFHSFLQRRTNPTQTSRQWSAFSSLMGDAPALPSHLLARNAAPPPPLPSSAPRSSRSRSSQSSFLQPRNPTAAATPAASSRPSSSRSSARRSSGKKAPVEMEVAEEVEREEDAMEDVVEVVSARRASGGRRGSGRVRAAEVEEAPLPVDVEDLWSEGGEEEEVVVVEAVPAKKASGGRRGSTRARPVEVEEALLDAEPLSEAEEVVPIARPSKQLSERRVEPVASGSGTRRQPVASGSGSRAVPPPVAEAKIAAVKPATKAKVHARTSTKRKSDAVVEMKGCVSSLSPPSRATTDHCSNQEHQEARDQEASEARTPSQPFARPLLGRPIPPSRGPPCFRRRRERARQVRQGTLHSQRATQRQQGQIERRRRRLRRDSTDSAAEDVSGTSVRVVPWSLTRLL